MGPETGVATRLASLRDRIARAAEKAGRSPEEILLVAVTKTVAPELIREAWQAGVRHFGENRVQEAAAKIPAVCLTSPDVTWHLVGHLQRNKARQAVELFPWIQSVDSDRLARELSNRASEQGRILHVLVEVNTSGEATKQGVAPEETPGLMALIAALPALDLRGLMTVGPLTDDEQKVRAAFRTLRRLAEAERSRSGDPAALPILSMGMTDDFEIAIAEGSSLIRVGRAIFGERRSG